MEEIACKRNIIYNKLEHLARATNNSNHRKIKSKLLKELEGLDQKAKEILTSKIINEDLTLEKFDVADATKYKNNKGIITYPTWYSPIENQPAAFIGSENLLKEFKIFPNEMKDEEIRNSLCNEQESNDRIIKAQEEEEEYEEIVIPKTQKKKHK